MKLSSRAGRFKKKLVSLENLQQEAPLMQEKLTPFLEQLSNRQISDAEFGALAVILSLSVRHPGTWLGARRESLGIDHQLNYIPDLPFEPNIKKRLTGMNLGEILNHFALKSTPLPVNRALLCWSTKKYPLELMFRIPTPEEVLNQQKQGRRCVTILIRKEQMGRFILGERDYLSFTMHDLIHADHFYFHNDCYQGQLGFYGLLAEEYGYFHELLKNGEFEREFEYLIADMNAYAIHLMKCLKSAVIHYGSQSHFETWVANFPVRDSLLLLNSPEYEPAHHDPLILEWLLKKAGAAPH